MLNVRVETWSHWSSSSPFVKRRRRSCQIVLLSSSADQRSPSRDIRKVLINIVSLSRGMQEVCRVKDATLTGALAAATPPAWKTRKYSCGKQDKKIPPTEASRVKMWNDKTSTRRQLHAYFVSLPWEDGHSVEEKTNLRWELERTSPWFHQT